MSQPQGELFLRRVAYDQTWLGNSGCGVILGCMTCERTYEPTIADFASGQTGCPICGGWTFIAGRVEDDPRC